MLVILRYCYGNHLLSVYNSRALHKCVNFKGREIRMTARGNNLIFCRVKDMLLH